jgi:hypothetical protein
VDHHVKRRLTGGWLLAFGLAALAALCLSAAPASASTLKDCLAQQHVCVASDGRSLVSTGQEAQLEKQIGGDDIYLVVAASGSSGYNASMDQLISDLNGHSQFTVGFLDTRQKHFGAYNKGMLPAQGAADIATRVVEQHQGDQNVFPALTEFVNDVQHEAGSTGSGTAASAPSHVLRNVLITLAVIVVLAGLGFFLIARPIRKRRQRELKELKEAKSAAQDDLIALSNGLTDHQADGGGGGTGGGPGRLRAGHRRPRQRQARQGDGRGQPGHRRGPVSPGVRRCSRGRPAQA